MPQPKKNRSKPAHQNKKVQVTDESGWTHIVRGPTAVRLSQTTTSSPSSQILSSSNGFKPGQSLKTLPGFLLTPAPLTELAQLEAEHTKQKAILSKDPIMTALLRDLGRGLLENEHATDIGNAICIGLGSLSTFRRAHCMRQLVAFEMAIDTLRRHGRLALGSVDGQAAKRSANHDEVDIDSKMAKMRIAAEHDESIKQSATSFPVYFQELRFTDLDREFLTSRGYTPIAVDDAAHEGESSVHSDYFLGPVGEYLHSSSFFFAPHLEVAVIKLAIEKAFPAIYFGSNIKAAFMELYEPSAARRSRTAKSDKKSSGSQGDDDGNLSLNDQVLRHLASRTWALSSGWYAPTETARTRDDDEEWASSFAFAFRANERSDGDTNGQKINDAAQQPSNLPD